MSELTVQAPIHSKYGAKSTAMDVVKGINLKGKNVIVTGGYSGVGLETTRALAAAGANVLVPVRNFQKAQSSLKGIPNVKMKTMNLMDPISIDNFAHWFLASGIPLHILINNAGIMNPPLRRDFRGYESQFVTNHLGHFQLTARLWPALKQAKGARVIAVSSRAQRLGGVLFEDPNFEKAGYNGMRAYAQSKSANVLFAVALDRLGKPFGVRSFAVHPGLIPTTDLSVERAATGKRRKIGLVVIELLKALHYTELRNTIKHLKPHHVADDYKSIQQGAATSVWCATSPELEDMGGVYCEDCNISEAVPANSSAPYGVRPWAIDPSLAERLWDLSVKMTGVAFKI